MFHQRHAVVGSTEPLSGPRIWDLKTAPPRDIPMHRVPILGTKCGPNFGDRACGPEGTPREIPVSIFGELLFRKICLLARRRLVRKHQGLQRPSWFGQFLSGGKIRDAWRQALVILTIRTPRDQRYFAQDPGNMYKRTYFPMIDNNCGRWRIALPKRVSTHSRQIDCPRACTGHPQT